LPRSRKRRDATPGSGLERESPRRTRVRLVTFDEMEGAQGPPQGPPAGGPRRAPPRPPPPRPRRRRAHPRVLGSPGDPRLRRAADRPGGGQKRRGQSCSGFSPRWSRGRSAAHLGSRYSLATFAWSPSRHTSKLLTCSGKRPMVGSTGTSRVGFSRPDAQALASAVMSSSTQAADRSPTKAAIDGTFELGGKGVGGYGTQSNSGRRRMGASSWFATDPHADAHTTSNERASSLIHSPWCSENLCGRSSFGKRTCSLNPSGSVGAAQGLRTPSMSSSRSGRSIANRHRTVPEPAPDEDTAV